MGVTERDGEIIFLRKLREGPAAESYGLHEAALAGLPERVLSRAGEIMSAFSEHKGKTPLPAPLHGVAAISPKPMLAAPRQEIRQGKVLKELDALDVNSMTPLDALNLIQKWKRAAPQAAFQANVKGPLPPSPEKTHPPEPEQKDDEPTL